MSWHMLAATAAAVAVRYTNYEPERPTPKLFVGTGLDQMEMAPSPIEPSWVLAGDPQARVAAHSKAEDECAATGVWDCTAGSFRWYFGWDETVVILEGEVHVTAEDGTERTLRPGDIAYFKGGTWAVWRIDTYVRKIAFLRKPFPAPLALLYKIKKMLRPQLQVGLAS
jgi:uncharacterized cupin superfamily protein